MSRFAVFLLALATCMPASGADLFVDHGGGSDANDGLSWASARATVASATATAAASPEPDVISVAVGRYLEHLVVPADTALLGGFPVGGGARDPAVNPTLLDGGGMVGSVVRFPPGSDRTLLDGFTVMGGEGTPDSRSVVYGGGILVEDAGPLIQGNVIEYNHACYGGGIALIYSAARSVARVRQNTIRRNGFPDLRGECTRGVRATGAAVYVSAPDGVDLGVVLAGNRIVENLWGRSAVWFGGGGAIEHDIVEHERGIGLELSGAPIRIFNTIVTGSPADAVLLTCGGDYHFENVTLAANAFGIATAFGPAPTSLAVEDAIIWGNATPIAWDCGGSPPTVVSSIVQGGFPGGVGIIDADPLFVPGPHGDAYLSQATSGQLVTSPAVDAGSQPSVMVGLDQRTTATDSAADTGVVDLGYHPIQVTPITLLRGAVPSDLTPYRTLVSLPFVDDPGTLSDPGLRLLFYEVAEASNQMAVEKATATDAVRLVFR